MIIELTQSNNEFHYIHLYNVTEVSGASDRHKDKHCHQVVEKWYCSAVTVTTVLYVWMYLNSVKLSLLARKFNLS